MLCKKYSTPYNILNVTRNIIFPPSSLQVHSSFETRSQLIRLPTHQQPDSIALNLSSTPSSANCDKKSAPDNNYISNKLYLTKPTQIESR